MTNQITYERPDGTRGTERAFFHSRPVFSTYTISIKGERLFAREKLTRRGVLPSDVSTAKAELLERFQAHVDKVQAQRLAWRRELQEQTAREEAAKTARQKAITAQHKASARHLLDALHSVHARVSEDWQTRGMDPEARNVVRAQLEALHSYLSGNEDVAAAIVAAMLEPIANTLEAMRGE